MTCAAGIEDDAVSTTVVDEWPSWARRVFELQRQTTTMAQKLKWNDQAYYATVDITAALIAKDDTAAAIEHLMDAMNHLQTALQLLADATG